MTVKLLWRTDVHLSDVAPMSRRDDWADTVFAKLDQIRRIAEREGVSAILDGGDFFHVKSPSRNSHGLVRRTADHHLSYPCPVYCTPGNHDSVYGDYAFLEQQPLGVLYSSQVFQRLYDDFEAFFEVDGVQVRVVGIPYHGTTYDMSRFHSIQRTGEDVLICVAHVLASLKGGTMFEGEDIVKYSDLLGTAPDCYIFGHWHKDQGVVQLGGKTFVNIGSLTRGSLSQDDLERRPSTALLTCTKQGVHVEVIPLHVASVKEVFDLEGRNRQVRQQMEMDTFIESVRNTLQSQSSDLTLSDTITGMVDLPEEIRKRALEYLEKA